MVSSLSRISTMLAAMVLAALATTGPARPCGYHGLLGDGFSAMHTRSVEVAIALRRAMDAGTLKEFKVLPAYIDLVGFHRSGRRLERLRDALQQLADEGKTIPAFSLLLIEPALWTRFSKSSGDMGLKMDTQGPVPGEATIVTGEAVISAILAGELSASDAIGRKLIVVAAGSEATLSLAPLLVEAFDALQPRT